MTKLMKEQVKFFIETMTDDMHNTTQHEIAETLLSKFDECESLQAKLLAYEQVAKNPVAWDYEWASCITCEGPQDFNRIIEREAPPDWAIDEGQARNIIPLYVVPVLPKQPESESIMCWSCKKTITLTQRAEADGFCPLCDAEIEIEPAPAQPVIPAEKEKPKYDPTAAWGYQCIISAEINGWNACRAEMLKAQQNEPQNIPAIQLAPHVYRDLVNDLRDVALEYHGAQQLRERISRALSKAVTAAHPYLAQPVSEPKP